MSYGRGTIDALDTVLVLCETTTARYEALASVMALKLCR